VTIVDSRTPEWTEGNEWHISDAVTRFDGVEFAGIAGAVRLPNGTTVVAEENGPRLHFFDTTGALVRSVGRRGDGPGEFQIPQFVGHTGDTVWVYDYAHSRVTRFDATGALLGTVNLTPPLPSALAIGDLDDGSLVLMGQWASDGSRMTQGLVRDSVAVVRYANGMRSDTIAVIPGREYVRRADETGRMVMSTAVFGRRASAVTWNGQIVLGTQIDRSLRVVGMDGRDRLVLRWPGRDLGLADTELSEWVENQVAAARSDQREGLRVVLESSPRPERRPAYGRLLASRSGELWVSEYSAPDVEPASWDVFSRDGVWLGRVPDPEHLRVLDVGSDWILVARLDSLGVEHLELRSLRS
jgi:hypothetical protein